MSQLWTTSTNGARLFLNAVKMCTQSMEWDLRPHISKPQTFREFAIKAHDMELTIANWRG